MNDMQCRDLIVSLSQHEEEGVKELGEFAEEIPPATSHHLQGLK
jgi:hypothetical protein